MLTGNNNNYTYKARFVMKHEKSPLNLFFTFLYQFKIGCDS